MIGQIELQERVRKLKEAKRFPHFAIFVGERGSGRMTFITENFKGIFLEDVKVDSIRNMIQMVYKMYDQVFVIPYADNMSNAARNALLKVVEECPNNNYFIMILEDENNTLETIRSRATIFHMNRYSSTELIEYVTKYIPIPSDGEKFINLFTDLCETPGEINILASQNAEDFYKYVQLVVDNIAEVSTANAFKIPSKVALKNDSEGYDLKLFWKAFIRICMNKAGEHNRTPEEILDYGEAVKVTSNCLQQLRIRGINKQMLMDIWVLEIRELWT